MKHYFDRFLLGALWIIATVLCASFWFNIRFGFDIFSRAHWKYLANVQVDSATVTPWFYISMIILCFIALAGLYLIFHYTGRKILFAKSAAADAARASAITEPQSAAATATSPAQIPAYAPAPPRPPRLSIPVSQQPAPAPMPAPAAARATIPVPVMTPAPAPVAPVRPSPAATVSPESEGRVRQIIQSAGFALRPAPNIGGMRPSVWALGSDEVLIIGLICPARGDITAAEGGASKWRGAGGEFDSPAWTLTGAIEKLRALFIETLDEEIKISIRPFVVMDGGTIVNADSVRPIWNAFGIDVFLNMDELARFMQDHRNRSLGPDEQGDFDAYVEYIDTVADYFNNQ